MDLRSLEKSLINICREAAIPLTEHTGKLHESQSRLKGFNQLVTELDEATEAFLVDKLGQLLPGCGFLTEENTTNDTSKDAIWVIDPIDGTTNFFHGLPVFSISVALMMKGRIVLGVVYDPNRDETFSAFANGGARLNGASIQCRNTVQLSDSLLATGFPYYDFDQMDSYLNCLKHLLRNTRGMRRMGSAAIDLAYVAAGRFDGFFEYGLSPWDVAAGALLVQEAGGVVTDFKGEKEFLLGKEIVAATAGIQPSLLEVIEQFFNKPKHKKARD